VKHTIKRREANDNKSGSLLSNNIYTCKFQISQSKLRAAVGLSNFQRNSRTETNLNISKRSLP